MALSNHAWLAHRNKPMLSGQHGICIKLHNDVQMGDQTLSTWEVCGQSSRFPALFTLLRASRSALRATTMLRTTGRRRRTWC